MKTLLAWLLVSCAPIFADDDIFRERFADPATRSEALSELIPGTRDAYFHTALDHQLAGREAEFQRTLAEWKAASERKDNPISAAGLTILENRQLLLDYRKDPQASLAELIRRLDLKFDDARPDAAAAAESLPTRLDPALISEDAFETAAATQEPRQPYAAYRAQRLYRELSNVKAFDETKTRWFLARLDRADLPGVVPLIDHALGLDGSLSFTQHPLLRNLTSASAKTRA